MKIEHFSITLTTNTYILVTGIDPRFNNFHLYADNLQRLVLRLQVNTSYDSGDNELYFISPHRISEKDFKIVCKDVSDPTAGPSEFQWISFHRALERTHQVLREKTISIEIIDKATFIKKNTSLEDRIRALYDIEFESVFDTVLIDIVSQGALVYDNYLIKVWNTAHEVYLENTAQRRKSLDKITGYLIKKHKAIKEERKEIITIS